MSFDEILEYWEGYAVRDGAPPPGEVETWRARFAERAGRERSRSPRAGAPAALCAPATSGERRAAFLEWKLHTIRRLADATPDAVQGLLDDLRANWQAAAHDGL